MPKLKHSLFRINSISWGVATAAPFFYTYLCNNDNPLLTRKCFYAIIKKNIPTEENYADYRKENEKFCYSQ